MHNEAKLKQALSDLLSEENFLPEGGTIGFGLLHKYPVSKSSGGLKQVLSCLKGSDAMIRRVCEFLGLELTPKVIYHEKYGDVLILVDGFVELEYVDSGLAELMCEEKSSHKGFIINSCGLEENGGGEFESPYLSFEESKSRRQSAFRSQDVWWLTRRTEVNRERSEYVAYGNEPSVSYAYADVVLVCSVGGHANRQGI